MPTVPLPAETRRTQILAAIAAGFADLEQVGRVIEEAQVDGPSVRDITHHATEPRAVIEWYATEDETEAGSNEGRGGSDVIGKDTITFSVAVIVHLPALNAGTNPRFWSELASRYAEQIHVMTARDPQWGGLALDTMKIAGGQLEYLAGDKGIGGGWATSALFMVRYRQTYGAAV